MGQAREGEERGRGIPLSDVSRVMRHYNIDEETACYWLTIHSVEELLPERGYGLTAVAAEVGITHSSCRFYVGSKCTNQKSMNFEKQLPPDGPSCPQFEPKGEIAFTQATSAQIVGYSRSDLEVALNAMEESLPEGGKAKLEICTEALPTEEDLAIAYLNMAGAGFHTSYPSARIVQGVPTTQFSLRKGSPQWALLIPLLPTALIVGLIAFGLVQIETIGKALLPLMITGAVGLVAVALIIRKPAERIAERAAERYLPKV